MFKLYFDLNSCERLFRTMAQGDVLHVGRTDDIVDVLWNTPGHELHTPGGWSEPGVTGPIFWYVIAEVFLHNISSGVEIL